MHADEVVSVHDGVYEAVEEDGKVNVPIVEHIRIEPVKEEDGCVMVNMQEGKLAPFLPYDDENSVPEVPNLRDVE